MTSTSSIIGRGSINHHDNMEDDNDDDIKDAQDDLAASIANRELLLTAAAMNHTNNNNDAICVLSNEIKMLRDEMRERFDVLEEKNSNININRDSSDNVDVSIDSKSVYKDEGGKIFSSPCMSTKVEKEIVSPAKDKEAKDGTEVTTSNQNKVLDEVVGGIQTDIGKDGKSTDDVEELLEDEDTAGDVAVEEEEELHVIINNKQQEERLNTPPTRAIKKGKRNKPRKQQVKGKRRQKKNKNNSTSSVTSAAIPGYCYILTIVAVTFVNAIKTLLFKRGGKRLYMLLAFISASYLFKQEMNSFSDILNEDSGRFSIGSFSFIQGVRALEDCPDQYIATEIDSYDIGSKVTIEEKVYECTESPCGWTIIGTCVGGMFLPSSTSVQPTIQTLGVPVHFPSMMPSALDTGSDGSNLFEIDSFVETEDSDSITNLPTSSGSRVRTHSPMSLGTHSPSVASPPNDNTDATSLLPTASSNCIDINIVYDYYPEETSWKLYRVNTDGDSEIKSHQGLSGDPPFTETICLEDGEYKFVISDSFGDGISSPGHYNVTLNNNGAVIAKGGEFEDAESTFFLLPYISNPSMSPSSSLYPTTTTRSPTVSPKPTTSISPTPEPKCKSSNQNTCGCASVKQADYRGTISITASGKECVRWDETEYFKPESYPNAGLEDNNYCRNPKGWVERAFCITADGSEDCDVPICEDSLPSAYPSSSPRPTTSSSPSTHPSLSPSMQPTISPKPTVSISPTQGPQCEGSNPKVCGCGSVNQADYRGTINTTVSGKECNRWDEQSSYNSENFPRAGLDNNYCRNPKGWVERAFCITADGSEDCDVPYCFPPASSCPNATTTSSLSEELHAACPYHQCIFDSDYELDDFQTLTRSDVKPDCSCAFEIWDCEFGSKECEQVTSEGEARKNANKCCVKLNDQNSTTQAASCECLIKPDCEADDSASCNDYAEYCCHENDQQCKCEYKTKACRLALESDSEEVSDMAFEYCGDSWGGGGAQDVCCGEDNHDAGLCTCDFWEPLCTDFPNADVNTCTGASHSCCDGKHCDCDLFTHAVEVLGYEDNKEWDNCARESDVAPDNEVELQSLQNIYIETGGEYWLNNTGWTSEENRCSWYGITCDEEGFVIEINLPNNNMTGGFPSYSLSSFYKLERLLLNNNALHGIMAATYDRNADNDDDIFNDDWYEEDLVTDASLFFNLRDLTHVDLSQNNLSGEVDVLFAPALQYTNFSHNNFTYINSFKKFKRSHQTLTICDVSHNFINTSATDLMKHVPTNIEQLILSNNLIYGTLPKSLEEELPNLRRFNISMNILSGELPDFSNSYPNLQVLDLSEQIGEGLVGNIPESLANLPFLSTLILTGNQLSNIIPPALGNMGQLRVLNLSNNKLSQPIPEELGKLGTIISYVHFFVLVFLLSHLYHTVIHP